jgi:deazaflavin-dependent oxidoreductase (nitroreductase family)
MVFGDSIRASVLVAAAEPELPCRALVPAFRCVVQDRVDVPAPDSGSTRDPAWLRNLEANPTPSVKVDGRQFEASATVAQGPERDRLWQQHLESQPQLAAHAEQAGRTIPIVRLTPR